jgi:hypothetical protein
MKARYIAQLFQEPRYQQDEAKMIQFYKDEKVRKQTKIPQVPEPTDTRVEQSKFT